MLDLNIDSLALRITNAAGHEHRVRPIAARAASIFAERVQTYCEERGDSSEAKHVSNVTGAPANVDLHRMSDEQAAQTIVSSWLDALKLM